MILGPSDDTALGIMLRITSSHQQRAVQNSIPVELKLEMVPLAITKTFFFYLEMENIRKEFSALTN